MTTSFFVGVLVLQSLNEIIELVSLAPQEHVQRQTKEFSVDSPVPQILEEIDEVVNFVPHKTRATPDRRA